LAVNQLLKITLVPYVQLVLMKSKKTYRNKTINRCKPIRLLGDRILAQHPGPH